MACYAPMQALQDGPSGAGRLWPPKGTANLEIPCGRCIGCRTDKATEWASRCTHEASLWASNHFVTLTYDDEHLPANGHLQARDLQLFIKRLRKYVSSSTELDRDPRVSVRYFACGEYGETTERPHYHGLFFNLGLTDLVRVGGRPGPGGRSPALYESAALRELWPSGSNRIGEATPAAAAYIAQYNLKKQGAGGHDRDGVERPPPFLRMSLKPAIGHDWLKRYQTDLQHGYLVTSDGRQKRIPRYYRKKVSELDWRQAEQMEAYTARRALTHPTDKNTPERRQDAEKIHLQKASLSSRDFS